MWDFIKKICIVIEGILVGAVVCGYWIGHKYCLKLVESRDLAEKHLNMVRLYDIWLMTKQTGMSIAEYLADHDIHKIAIYGMSYMGIRLFHDLESSSIHVKYGIDGNSKMRVPGIKIYHPDELQEKEIDAVIVTAIFSFDCIKKDLHSKGFKRIIALDELLYNLIL